MYFIISEPLIGFSYCILDLSEIQFCYQMKHVLRYIRNRKQVIHSIMPWIPKWCTITFSTSTTPTFVTASYHPPPLSGVVTSYHLHHLRRRCNLGTNFEPLPTLSQFLSPPTDLLTTSQLLQHDENSSLFWIISWWIQFFELLYHSKFFISLEFSLRWCVSLNLSLR